MVKNKYSNNFIWAIIDRGGMLFFQFLALLYLSRIISPYDFGLIAILNIFIVVSNVVIDSGMVGALIRKQDAKPIDYYTLFGYNFFLAILIYLLLFISAPYIALFYEIPLITKLIRVLSLTVLINSFGLVQMVKLTKSLNFKAQAIITIISQFISVLFSILLAKKGYGVWSLVSLQLTHVIISTIILVFYNKFIPKLKFSKKSFKDQFQFGGPLLVSNILYIVNTNIYSSLIGKFLTALQSGYFYQGYKLQNTPTGILSAIVDKVAFTLLSKESKKEKIIFLGHKIYKVIYLIIIPVFLFVYIISEYMFLVFFNEEWKPAALVFKILCLSLIPISIRMLNRNMLKSFGKTKTILKIEIINTILSIGVLMYTISFGLSIIAYGVFFTNIIMALISIYYLYNKLEYSFSLQLSVIMRPLIKGLIPLLLLSYVFQKYNGIDPSSKYILYFLLYFLSYFLFSFNEIKKINK